MSSVWHSTRASLDESSALFRESLGKLKAAQSVETAEVIEQLKMTAESARMLRELVWSELPEASWQSREELDTLVDEIQKNLAARALGQRSRLLALASELERGTIVHRRAHRVQELNNLRDQAVEELRLLAGLDGAPEILPGPEADQWIGWACGLQEPHDTESLQALRKGFVHLDDFVGNLEPNMWRAGESPIPEAPPEAARPADKAQPERFRLETNRFEEPVVSSGPKQIQLQATERSNEHDKPRFPRFVGELPPQALDLNTLTPNDASPPPTQKDVQKAMAPEQALLAGMMDLVTDPVAHFNWPVELPFTGEAFRGASVAASAGTISDRVGHFNRPVERSLPGEAVREASAVASAGTVSDPVGHFNRPVERSLPDEAVRETSAAASAGAVSDPVGHFNQPVDRSLPEEAFREPSPASEVFFKIRLGLEGRRREKRGMLLAIAAVLVLAALGAILWSSRAMWRSGGKNTSTARLNAVETKATDLPPGNPEHKGNGQPAISADSETRTSTTKNPGKEQSKPKDQSVTSKPPSKNLPAQQTGSHDDGVLRPPVPIPKDIAAVKKEEAPPNLTAEMSGSIPGGSPSGVSNRLPNIVGDIPVAVPKIESAKVRISSGIAQGMLIHQVTPRYPAQAKQVHIQGMVVLQAVIGKDGSVRNLQVLSGNPMLIEAAINAVRQWRYKPYNLNGEPVEADTQINVNFRLSGE